MRFFVRHCNELTTDAPTTSVKTPTVSRFMENRRDIVNRSNQIADRRYNIDMHRRLFFVVLVFVLCAVFRHAAAETVRPIIFPVQGEYTFRDDWHEPRGGGTRLHLGNDIIAKKMTPLVAVVDGIVSFVARPEAHWGYEVEIQDSEGYSYSYLHINNDTPGTDDGAGGEANAYPPTIQRGVTVGRGTVIGWVGDSGNAEGTVPHLHFEIRDPHGTHINPYPSLLAASGGKGVSASAPRTNTPDSAERERLLDLRHIFTKELTFGVESAEVRQLQRVLQSLGHFNYPYVTGYFGEVTQKAVMSYQRKKGLPETGIVNVATRRALNTDLGTWDPNDYQPFYSKREEIAIQIQRLTQQIALLQAQLKALRGY